MTDHRQGATPYYAAVRLILLTEWDPIGISQFSGAQDEYDGYVSGVCSLLISGVDRDSLFFHLWQLETDHMGLSDTPAGRQHTYAVVDRLLQLRDDMEPPHTDGDHESGS